MNKIDEIRKFIDCALLTFYESPRILEYLNNESLVIDNEDTDIADAFLKGVTGRDRCLEFGCGNGRYLEYFSQYFNQVDGCDLSYICREVSSERLAAKEIKGEIYKVDYESIESIPNDVYDFIYSITVFQHLPVYTLRKMYLEQIYNKLKTGGKLLLQMCAGRVHFNNSEWGTSSNYYDDSTETRWTNSRHDVAIERVEYLEKDLIDIGFKNIKLNVKNYSESMFGTEIKNDCWMFHDKVVFARCEK